MLELTHILVRSVLSASAAFTIGLLSYDGITTWLWRLAFPSTLPEVRDAGGALLGFGYGLGMPFVYFGAPLVFVVIYPAVTNLLLKSEERRWLFHALVGAAAWAALSVLQMASLVTDPPLADPVLGARAWIVVGGFAVYLALIGASAGLLCRLIAGEGRKPTPAGPSVDLNGPL